MGETILVVEDEPTIVENIVYSLRTDGYAPVACGTGEEALEKVRGGDGEGIALVVLDVGLPDMSGFEVCKAIRERSRVPIIFLTARESEIDRVVGLEIGADDYMVKPFSPRELSARVRAVLRRAAGMPEVGNGAVASGGGGEAAPTNEKPEGKIGDERFTVDEGRMQISYHGEVLGLSRYEYRLLCIFVERPGRVYSREQLMDMAWEEPEAAMERTVDTHIKSLRAKLKAVRAEVDPIRTHRGMGYSLREN
ncbi:MAG: two-component system response regulator CreB [Verrucomicrobiota bacterium]